MIPVEPIPGIVEVAIKKNGGGKFKYYIFNILLKHL
jgi:hypothetical protein